MVECSSCLTSSSVPSVKVQLTMSVSSEAPLTKDDLEMADQKEDYISVSTGAWGMMVGDEQSPEA